MCVASGRFVPTPAYASIQSYCIKHREHWVSIPGLTAWVAGGAPIECSGVFKSSTLALNSAKQESKSISAVLPIRRTVNYFDTMWKPTRNNLDSSH